MCLKPTQASEWHLAVSPRSGLLIFLINLWILIADWQGSTSVDRSVTWFASLSQPLLCKKGYACVFNRLE
jgi:hypothetical protein